MRIILLLFIFSHSSFGLSRALNTAATGMAAQEAHVSTISNNIANVNTNGFKKERVEFESLHYQTIKAQGSQTGADSYHNIGHQVGSGSKVSGVSREFTQGSPQITNNPFDLMINGEGFFGVIMPDQTIAYTRDGSFNVNSQGVLVNRSGFAIIPNLQFPPDTISVNITEEGTVEAFIKNQVEPTNVGQIPVFTFTNNTGLVALGGNNYKPSRSSGVPIQNVAGEAKSGSIRQGALESSNVSIMNEMTELIKAQRAYEMNSKVMKVADEILQTVNTIR
ncbi:MAG: flagellar basal-body rod protein FlgG [Bdellovibrionota bacterium]|nr:flagellar basal-body rod protein FlgG [Bdellovibrionota bacterium]